MKRVSMVSLLTGAAMMAAVVSFSGMRAGAQDTAAATAPAAAPAATAATVDSNLGVPPRDPREPSPVPVSWELNIKHGPLERLIINIDGKEQTYWYMRYTVTNNSGRDVLFTPNFQIVAETGSVIPQIKNAPAAVFDKIKSLYGNPLLMSPLNIDGKLLQGEDNAKDSVAIFPALDGDARNFQVFMTGLSGETSEVTNPMTKKPVILQKTLELDFNIPGQAIGIEPVVKLTGTKWVMK